MRNISKKAIRITWDNEKYRSAGDEDKFIINYFNGKSGGYLLDIACACPVSGSLSYKLLNDYDWYGILVEPSILHKENIEKCYGDVKGIHFFRGAINQTENKISLHQPKCEISVGMASTDTDHFSHYGISDYVTYDVESISIMNLLKKYDAPRNIDFLNLDIEGSEPQVLDYLDFSMYNIQLICIENGLIYRELMESKGYKICDFVGYKLSHGNLFYEKV